jgi:carbon monoxide dehydrogenase subunit G
LRFTGSAEMAADRETVWTFLVDPSNAGPCSPVPIERIDSSHFQAQARLGSGFFSTTVRLALEVVDVVEGRSARVTFRGGASGTSLEGVAAFTIRAEPGALTTIVDWDADVDVTGTFAGQAARLVGDRAPEAIERFTDCIRRQVER